MYTYFEKYIIYYESLLGNEHIVSDANGLATAVSDGATSVNNFFNKINSSNWEEDGQVIATTYVFTGLNTSIKGLSDMISDNLVNACTIAINSLLPTLEEIKIKDEELYFKKEDLLEQEAHLEEMKRQEPSEKDPETGETSSEYIMWQESITAQEETISRIKTYIEQLIKELEALCEKADGYIKSIQNLNQSTAELSITTTNMVSKDLAEYLLSLSDEELASFLSSYPNGLVLEIYPDLIKQLGLDSSITIIDQIPIRFDIASIYQLLNGNQYRDMIMDYLLQYAAGSVDVNSIYQKYYETGLLPEWKSSKNSMGNSLFDFFTLGRAYNEEAMNAMNLVLDHTIAQTMLPFYENGTLDMNKAIQCGALVLASDYLVHFSYGNGPLSLQDKYMWREDTSAIVGIGGGNCHLFADGVLFRAMSLFSSNSLIDVDASDKDILVREKEADISPFARLFKGVKKIPGSEGYATTPYIEKLTNEEAIEAFVPGTVAASTNKTHVIISLYEAYDSEGNKINIIADSKKPENGGIGVSIRLAEESDKLHTYIYQVNEDEYERVANDININGEVILHDTAINFEEYANKYGVNVN